MKQNGDMRAFYLLALQGASFAHTPSRSSRAGIMCKGGILNTAAMVGAALLVGLFMGAALLIGIKRALLVLPLLACLYVSAYCPSITEAPQWGDIFAVGSLVVVFFTCMALIFVPPVRRNTQEG